MAEITRRNFFRLSGAALIAVAVMPTALLEAAPVVKTNPLFRGATGKYSGITVHDFKDVSVREWSRRLIIESKQKSFFYGNKGGLNITGK